MKRHMCFLKVYLLLGILIKFDLPNVETIYFGYAALYGTRRISISSKVFENILIVRYSTTERDKDKIICIQKYIRIINLK